MNGHESTDSAFYSKFLIINLIRNTEFINLRLKILTDKN